MAFLKQSTKLHNDETTDQMIVSSEGFVLMRLLHNATHYVLMTATAAEDDGSLRAYHDLDHLASVAESIFERGARKHDRQGRPYFEMDLIDHPTTVHELANKVCSALGLEACKTAWADEEMRALYEEFSNEKGERTYLSDGVYLDSRGRLSDG